MSDFVFPKFPGLDYNVIKTPVAGRTLVAKADSGAEVRLATWTQPLWMFELTYEFIAARQGYANGYDIPTASALITGTPYISNDVDALMSFIMARQGGFDSWLFDDPTDNSIIQASLGAGDGVTTAFQAVRQRPYFSEPVQNLNGAVGIAGQWSPGLPVAAAAPVVGTPQSLLIGTRRASSRLQTPGWPCVFTANSGGTTGAIEPNWGAARAFGMQVTESTGLKWTNQGVITMVYLEGPATDWASSQPYVLSATVTPSVNNAGGYMYVAQNGGTSSGGSVVWPQQLGATFSDNGIIWKCFGLAPFGQHGGRLSPRITTTYAISPTGVITFALAPAAGQWPVLTSGFYFRCRFAEDRYDFKEMWDQFYSLGKLNFESVKL